MLSFSASGVAYSPCRADLITALQNDDMITADEILNSKNYLFSMSEDLELIQIAVNKGFYNIAQNLVKTCQACHQL